MSPNSSAPIKPATIPTPKYSRQMRAVFALLAAGSVLYSAVSPAIDFANEAIDWDQIFGLALDPGHKMAAECAICLWRDEFRDFSNLYNSLLSTEPHLQRDVVKALAIRLGVWRRLRSSSRRSLVWATSS